MYAVNWSVRSVKCGIIRPARVTHKLAFTNTPPLPLPNTTTAGMAAVKSGQLLSPSHITSFYQRNTGAKNKHCFIAQRVVERKNIFTIIAIYGPQIL